MTQVARELFSQLWGVPYIPPVVIIGIVVLLIQWAKSKGLDKRYAPLVSVTACVLLSVVNALVLGIPVVDVIAQGIVTGLVASGSFSAIKSIGKVGGVER